MMWGSAELQGWTRPADFSSFFLPSLVLSPVRRYCPSPLHSSQGIICSHLDLREGFTQHSQGNSSISLALVQQFTVLSLRYLALKRKVYSFPALFPSPPTLSPSDWISHLCRDQAGNPCPFQSRPLSVNLALTRSLFKQHKGLITKD